jgi:glycosyltransferase involved in cell wall biosynthesis
VTEKLLVSILINNYNYGHFLEDAINSALNQSYHNTEVIIVDDGSTDGSQTIIESYKDKVASIFKQNGGQASAFNVGFAASHGDIICFLDADDIFHSDKISEVVNALKDQPEARWYFHNLLLFRRDSELDLGNVGKQDKPYEIYDLREPMKRGKLKGYLPKEIDIATSGMCFKRDILQKILPMPEAIRITSDDYIKYVALGTSPGFIDLRTLALQRIHDNNAYTLRPNKVKLKTKIEVLTAYCIRKNFPELLKFTNNLFALNMNNYWKYLRNDTEYQKLIENYLALTSMLEKPEIYIRALYHYLRRWIKR